MKVYVVVSVWKQEGELAPSSCVVDCTIKESDAQKTLQREKQNILKTYWKDYPYTIEEYPNNIYIYGEDDCFDLITLEERELR